MSETDLDNAQRLLAHDIEIRAMGSIDEVVASDGLERIDLTARTKDVPRGYALLVRGWIGDGSSRATARSVAAFVDGVPVTIRDRNPRTDVASVTGYPALEYSGFRIIADTAALAPGTHLLRIVAQQADGRASELEPLPFTVVASGTTADSGDVFQIEISAFHGDNVAPQVARHIEKGYVAIVSGTLRERGSARSAASLYAIVDHFDGVRGQTGYGAASEAGDEPSAFVAFFPTRELELGEHVLHLVARTHDGRRQSLGPYPFAVTPACCDLAHPIPSDVLAEAELTWADGPSEPASAARLVRANEAIHVRGWALDPLTRGSVGTAFVAFENGDQYWLSARQFRPELAPPASPPDAVYCGIVGSIAAGNLGAGKHCGRLFVRSKDGTHYFRTEAFIALEVQ